jgi:N-acetylmuramoyl-L-alanine amidase-like protein
MRGARDRAGVSGPGAGATLGAVGRTTFTRRRALALGAAAGLGSLLAPLREVPAFAASASRSRLGTRPRGFGLTVTPADFDGGRLSRVLRVRRFDLLGVRGSGHVEVRVRRSGGAWSGWVPLAAHGDHAPDTGTGARASDPVWTGGSDELQLRLARAPRASLRVHFVAVPAAARRRASAGASRAAGRARAAQAGGVQAGGPPPMVPRAAWGADAVPPRSGPSYGVVQAAFVHHTVTANEYGPQDSAAIVLGILKYHRDTNGWNDIGYNFLVDKYGQIFEGRAGGIDQAVVGAHAQGYNAQSTSVAQLGTYTAGGVTPQALEATARLLGWKLSLHGVPALGTVVLRSGGGSLNRFPSGTPVTVNRICGHRDGDATSCPGDALYAQLPALRARAAALAGPVAAPQGQVTLAVAAAAVPYGQAASFSGLVIRPGGGAAAGVPVALQKRGRTGGWVTVARATAAADGSWTVQVPWRRTGEVRARSGSASSAVASVAVVGSVTLRRPARRRVTPGTLTSLSGRVKPARPVRVLVEFKGRDGRWRRVRVLRARARGTSFSAALRLRRPGLYRLTARTAGPGGHVKDEPLLVRVVRSR